MKTIEKLRLTLAFLVGFATTACFAAEKTYTFGFIAKSNDNPVFQSAKTGAEDEAAKLSEEHGVEIKIDWRTPNEEDPQKQADAVEQLVNAGANGIAISASDANKLTDAINKAVDSGVPVVMFDSDAPKSKRFAIFGSDDIDLGKKVMSELAKEMGGKGAVAILAGNQNAPNLQKRVQGVKEEAKKYPDINILNTFYHKETPEDAAAKVEQVMQAHPEITGWAMIGGWPLFADNAFKFAPGTVKVVAVDALPAQLGYLRSGHVQVLIDQQVYEWGSKSVDLLYDKVAENKNPPSSFVKAELIPVTKDNVDESAKNWEKWSPVNRKAAPLVTDAASVERVPHVDCTPSEPVEPGKVIQVEVYADTNDLRESEDQTGKINLTVPPSVSEIPVVVYLLLSRQFRFVGSIDSNEIIIQRSQATSTKATFKLKVEPNAEGRGYVTALFFYKGYPCGRVRRSIAIGIPDGSNVAQQTNSTVKTPPANTAPSRISVPSDGPDMTIVVVQTDTDPKRYQSFVLARNAKQPRGEVSDWDNYANPTPEKILQSYYDRFGEQYPPRQARASLVDLGKKLFNKAPANVNRTLLELFRKSQPPRTVLVFSDEPYFPWELMIPHWPDRDVEENLPLGVTETVARWTLDPYESFRSPARSVAIGKAVFWAPHYKDNPLTSSADEQNFLTGSLQGIPINPATYDAMCETLASSDATVLHFICHGLSDPQNPGMQTILAEPQKRNEPDQPLEGEAPSTQYYRASITPGELEQCDGIKQFCAKRPLIFLNACQIGGNIETMTSVGGFGPTFLKMNAGAVIAPLWSVFEKAAEKCAESFYLSVQQNPHETFAEAVRKIRETAFKVDPPEGLATYAAYCFYGDPLAAPANAPSH